MKQTLALFVPVLAAAACGGPAEDACAPGATCVWAGTGERGFNNLNPEAHRLDSKLYAPADVTFAADGRAYIADWNNHRIRRVELDQTITTVVGTDYEGDGPPDMSDRLPLGNPTGALGTEVAMNHPTDIEFGPDGRMYIAAWHNNKIRVWDPETEILTSLAGDGYGFRGDGEPCYKALFNQPKSVVFGDDGSLYTIDQRNVRIRRIGTDEVITTIAGTGVQGNTGDGGPAAEASFGLDIGTTPRISGSLVYHNNALYIADSNNNRIRKLDLATNTITAVAGDVGGAEGYADGVGAAARFNQPIDMEIGPEGLLYVADRYNNAIRTVDLTTGEVATVAGNAQPCTGKACLQPADGVAPLDVQLAEPYGVSFDATGNMYITDTNNHRILKVTR